MRSIEASRMHEQTNSLTWIDLGFQFCALILALRSPRSSSWWPGAPAARGLQEIILGAARFGQRRFSDVLVAWVPLLLATAGLVDHLRCRAVEHRRGRADHARRDRHHDALRCPAGQRHVPGLIIGADHSRRDGRRRAVGGCWRARSRPSAV